MRLPWVRRRPVASHKHAKRTICNNCRDEIGPDIHLVTTKRGLLGSPGRCHKILGPFTKGIIIGSIYDDYDVDANVLVPYEPEGLRLRKFESYPTKPGSPERAEGQEHPGSTRNAGKTQSTSGDPYDRVEEALQELEAEA